MAFRSPEGENSRRDYEDAEEELKRADDEKALYRQYYGGRDPEQFAGFAAKLGERGSRIFSELFLTYGSGLDTLLARIRTVRKRLKRLESSSESEARELNEQHRHLIDQAELSLSKLAEFERVKLGMERPSQNE